MLNALCGSVIIAQTPFDVRGAVDPASIDTLVDFYLSDGACLLHVARESRLDGPLALVRDGDPIRLDASGRRPDLRVEAEAPPGRLDAPPRRYARGYTASFLDRMRQAGEGRDFDVLDRGPPPPEPEIN